MRSIVIGNFDGVHLGHQALIREALAQTPNGRLDALTFSPHPRLFFNPDQKNFLLCDEGTKKDLLIKAGIADVHVLPFDHEMAGLSAQAFIEEILIQKLDVTQIFVGSDFRFGRQRTGDIDLLKSYECFDVQSIDLKKHDDELISSSSIRAHLYEGNIDSANRLLGWDWFIKGKVQKGDQRGRDLGYPTANMAFGGSLVPSHGVYAVRALVRGVLYNGVANIGIRPMFELQEPLLETYILDFESSIYDEELKIFPVHHLRGEANFDNVDALKAQMALDSQQARTILNGLT